MARIKIDMRRKPIPQQIELSRKILGKMAGNPDFPSPTPTLLAIKNETDALEQAYIEALNYDREKKKVMHVWQKRVYAMIVQLADYVQQASGGDAEKILGSGFGVRRERSASAPPPVPAWVKPLHDDKENEIDLRWQAVSSAKAYVIEITEQMDSVGEVFRKEMSTKSRFTITRLKTNTRYWFRVKAFNAAGDSGWSDWVRGRTM